MHPVRHPTARRSTAEFLRPPRRFVLKWSLVLSVTQGSGFSHGDRLQKTGTRAAARKTKRGPQMSELVPGSLPGDRNDVAGCMRPTTRNPRTSLRTKSIGLMTKARYRVEIKQFLGHCDNQPSLRVQTQRDDETLARHFNTIIFRSHGISDAEQTLVGLTHFDARFFSRIGTEALPKAVRSPRGWRRLALLRSRKACALGHDGLEGGRARASTHGSLSCTALVQLLQGQRDAQPQTKGRTSVDLRTVPLLERASCASRPDVGCPLHAARVGLPRLSEGESGWLVNVKVLSVVLSDVTCGCCESRCTHLPCLRMGAALLLRSLLHLAKTRGDCSARKVTSVELVFFLL